MSFRFSKAMRLRSRYDYKRMASRFTRLHGSLFNIDVKHNSLKITRLGITVPKRYGDAHHRNRIKRLLREAFRLGRLALPVGIDMNVRPKQAALGVSLQAVQKELLQLLLPSQKCEHVP